MVPHSTSLRWSFSSSFFHHCPVKINISPRTNSKSTARSHKYFSGNLISSLDSAGFSSTASSHALEEVYEGEDEKNLTETSRTEEFKFLHLMDERGISANYHTYLWLSEACLNSKSLSDAKKLHGRIWKLGFNEEYLCGRLIEMYITNGNINDAFKLFDGTSYRNVSSYNKMISALGTKKMANHVLNLFSQMLARNVTPDEITFANVLRACACVSVPFHYVEQLHAKIIRHGFGTSTVVCNPLIDFYSKHGSIKYAKQLFEKLCFKDNVTWVAMISGLSQNGLEEDAIHLFCHMHELGILPTPYVISSVVSACTKLELFYMGEQLHDLIFKWGFSSETFVCNALLTLYSRFGKLKLAEQLFSKMQQRDKVSYNSLISGLAQSGIYDKALQLFEFMQLDCLEPDAVTVASLLSACASVGDLCKGKQLHCYAIKAGMSLDVIIEGSLLDLYVKCSDIETAREFFSSTETENVVLWNVMLVAYGQLGNLYESFKIFSQMQIEGLRPNQFTYPSILRTCTLLGALDLGEQIHNQVIKAGFQPNVYVCSVLIDMYSKHGKLDTALEIFRRLNEEDVVSWTAMIAGYAQHDMYIEALKLFKEMQNRGIKPDNVGFSSAISACAGIQAFNQGRQIHAQSFIFGYSSDLSIGNAVVSLYARCGKVQEAYSAFKNIDLKDNISWNGLISGFSQSGHCEEALQVFSQMNKHSLEANMFTFCSAVSAAANIANVKQGKQIHAKMIKTGYNSETEASNVLITLYAKCGNIDDAEREFYELDDKNEVSWNAIITGYSQHGCGNEALTIFEEMKRSGVVPTHVTFVGVLSACSHVGLVNEGLNYFKSMKEQHGLEPRLEHYACVVDILGRAGSLGRAVEFIKEMPVVPDAMIWRMLLSACRVHKNMKIGEIAASHLLELEPEDSATYVLLSNIYAVAGKWESRDRVRQMMKDRGVKKEPGRSWIEIKNKFHAFYVGDKLHPLTDKIYEFLEDLNERVGEIGYVRDQSSLWNDVEQSQKDPSVYVHSEKLAVAFGLLSSSYSIPIRVMKNLRVCNDCHNWLKFVSKVSNRAIVVRDAYRFHHFENGFCSCKDYW